MFGRSIDRWLDWWPFLCIIFMYISHGESSDAQMHWIGRSKVLGAGFFWATDYHRSRDAIIALSATRHLGNIKWLLKILRFPPEVSVLPYRLPFSRGQLTWTQQKSNCVIDTIGTIVDLLPGGWRPRPIELAKVEARKQAINTSGNTSKAFVWLTDWLRSQLKMHIIN